MIKTRCGGATCTSATRTRRYTRRATSAPVCGNQVDKYKSDVSVRREPPLHQTPQQRAHHRTHAESPPDTPHPSPLPTPHTSHPIPSHPIPPHLTPCHPTPLPGGLKRQRVPSAQQRGTYAESVLYEIAIRCPGAPGHWVQELDLERLPQRRKRMSLLFCYRTRLASRCGGAGKPLLWPAAPCQDGAGATVAELVLVGPIVESPMALGGVMQRIAPPLSHAMCKAPPLLLPCPHVAFEFY